MSLFIIADTHFGHDNIKLYEPLRQSIDDEMMIDLWNSIVTDEDEVWHLGDFAFKSKGWDYAKVLKGKITLLKGNHDFKKSTAFLKEHGFKRVIDSIVLDIPLEEKQMIEQRLHDTFSQELLSSCICWIQDFHGKRILFSHYPCFYHDVYAKESENERKAVLETLFDWCHCDLNYHGHIHSKINEDKRCVNVGVEHTRFMPLKLC